MTTTVELISQVVDELKTDPNLRINSATLITRRLNSAIRNIQARAGYSFTRNQEVLTFSGAFEYALPANFAVASRPNSVKCGQRILSPELYHDLVARNDINTVGEPNFYYIRYDGTQDVIGVYPRSQQTLIVPVNNKLEPIDNITPSPLPDDFDDAIVYYTIYLLMKRIRGFEEKAREYLEHFNIEFRGVLGAELAKSKPLVMRPVRRRGY